MDGFDVNSVNETSLHGYMLEADLEYPDELHGLHDDYRLVTEKLEIDHGMLSRYCNDIVYQCGMKVDSVNKLIPHLDSKSKYVLHYRNLHLYLLLGMKLIVVQRNLRFKQSNWLKKYIDFNTSKSKNALNSFEKDLF